MPRENERVSLLTEISLESTAGKRKERISDLSVGGCYVESIVPVNEGEAVGLRITLPAGGALALKGEVAYTLVGGFGVRFIDIADDDRQVLNEIIGSSEN